MLQIFVKKVLVHFFAISKKPSVLYLHQCQRGLVDQCIHIPDKIPIIFRKFGARLKKNMSSFGYYVFQSSTLSIETEPCLQI